MNSRNFFLGLLSTGLMLSTTSCEKDELLGATTVNQVSQNPALAQAQQLAQQEMAEFLNQFSQRSAIDLLTDIRDQNAGLLDLNRSLFERIAADPANFIAVVNQQSLLSSSFQLSALLSHLSNPLDQRDYSALADQIRANAHDLIDSDITRMILRALE